MFQAVPHARSKHAILLRQQKRPPKAASIELNMFYGLQLGRLLEVCLLGMLQVAPSSFVHDGYEALPESVLRRTLLHLDLQLWVRLQLQRRKMHRCRGPAVMLDLHEARELSGAAQFLCDALGGLDSDPAGRPA
eukprot:2098989-Alexandrium_andersonii.AAC.1